MSSFAYRAVGAGVLALALALAGGSAAAAAAPYAAPMAAIQQFVDAFDSGDSAKAAAAYAPSPVIIDEPAPHIWSGPTAFQDWSAALAAESRAAGESDERIRLGREVTWHVEADTAYISARAAFLYRVHGRAMIEPATWTFALARQSGAWKITGWSWNAQMPHPVTALRKGGAAPVKPKA